MSPKGIEWADLWLDKNKHAAARKLEKALADVKGHKKSGPCETLEGLVRDTCGSVSLDCRGLRLSSDSSCIVFHFFTFICSQILCAFWHFLETLCMMVELEQSCCNHFPCSLWRESLIVLYREPPIKYNLCFSHID